MQPRLLVLALLFANLMAGRVCGQQTTDSSDLTTSPSDPGSSYGVFSSSASSSAVSSAVTDPPLNVSSSTMLHSTSPSIQMSSTNFGAPATAARTSFFTDTSSSPSTTPNVPKSTSAFTAQANFSTLSTAGESSDSTSASISFPMDFVLNLNNTMLRQLPADLPNISSTCLSDLQEFLNASSRMEAWALKMLDAMGKLQAGVLKGQNTLVGQYDEYREISQNGHVIEGLFCTPEVMVNFSGLGGLRMPFNQLSVYVDVCLPGSCTDADVFTICDKVAGGLGSQLKAAKCIRHKDPSSDAAFWVAIAVMSLLAVLCACGTTYGVVRKRKEEKERKYKTEKTRIINGFLNGAYDSKGDTGSNDTLGMEVAAVVSNDHVPVAVINGLKIVVSENEAPAKVEKNKSVGLASHLLLCFSVLNNGKKLLDCSRGQADLSCLHGLRVISITWVVLAHCFSMFLGANTLVDVLRRISFCVKHRRLEAFLAKP